MPMTNLGMSLLEEEMRVRDLPTHEEKASLMQIREAVESKLHGHKKQAASSMMMMKAHLMYMEAAGKAVKQTTSLIQEVAADDSLQPEEKMQALDHLQAHLKRIQSDVEQQQSKISSLAEIEHQEAALATPEELDTEEDTGAAPVATSVDAVGNLRHSK